MLHQGFSESAGKVLNNFKCVWVTDMWIIVSSLQLPLHWTTLNNKQHLRLTVSLLRLSPLKVINLFVSLRLISRFLPSLISVFLPVFCRSPSLPVAPRASVEKLICMRPNCCSCLCACQKSACGPYSDVCIAEYFVFGWLHPCSCT